MVAEDERPRRVVAVFATMASAREVYLRGSAPFAWPVHRGNGDQPERNAEIGSSNATSLVQRGHVARAHEGPARTRVSRRWNMARTPRAAS